ncbi:hypothetical protein BD413DRAFT_674460, partial [Trametes elegans]
VSLPPVALPSLPTAPRPPRCSRARRTFTVLSSLHPRVARGTALHASRAVGKTDFVGFNRSWDHALPVIHRGP